VYVSALPRLHLLRSPSFHGRILSDRARLDTSTALNVPGGAISGCHHWSPILRMNPQFRRHLSRKRRQRGYTVSRCHLKLRALSGLTWHCVACGKRRGKKYLARKSLFNPATGVSPVQQAHSLIEWKENTGAGEIELLSAYPGSSPLPRIACSVGTARSWVIVFSC
jgi:hypothetical protein